MTSSEIVDAFFESYRAAFERFDAGAVGDHFGFPLHVTGDAEGIDVRCVGDREEWLGTLTLLLDLYKGFGVKTATVLESSTAGVSDRLIQAQMHWSLRDDSDSEIYDFHGLYTLADYGDRWKVVAIAHDELPKITALLSPDQ